MNAITFISPLHRSHFSQTMSFVAARFVVHMPQVRPLATGGVKRGHGSFACPVSRSAHAILVPCPNPAVSGLTRSSREPPASGVDTWPRLSETRNAAMKYVKRGQFEQPELDAKCPTCCG